MRLFWFLLVFAAVGIEFFSLPVADGSSVAAMGGRVPGAVGGLVLVPEKGGEKEGWRDVVELALRRGISTVAVDLRGQGANPPLSLGASDSMQMGRDVQAGVAYLRSSGAYKICIVGMELGGTLALRVAGEDGTIGCVGVLSPALLVDGMSSQEALARYGARPLLLAASADDIYGTRSLNVLEKRALSLPTVVRMVDAGSGAQVFRRDASLAGIIVGFVARYIESEM